MRIQDISLKGKVLVMALLGIALITVIITSLYIRDIKKQAVEGILEKSRAIVYTVEATREAMSDKLAMGVITDLETLSDEGNRAKLLEAVPIITAMNVAAKNAELGKYTFRVPKFQPRNPKNEPVGIEIDVLRELEKGQLDEYVVMEPNQIRYFKPIRLSAECLYCHGDPAGSIDPVGGIREGWKVGEVHGAFQIISSLEGARQTEKKATLNISLFAGVVMLMLGLSLFFMIRLVLKPIISYTGAFKLASTGNLTVRADVKGRDEVGRIALFFNDFIATLEKMVRELKGMTAETDRISQDLAASSEETAASLHEIRVNTEGMKNKIVTLDGEVSSSTRSADELGEIGRASCRERV